MNNGTSLKSIRQIRWSEYPEYNLVNTRTAKLIKQSWILTNEWMNEWKFILVNETIMIDKSYAWQFFNNVNWYYDEINLFQSISKKMFYQKIVFGTLLW